MRAFVPRVATGDLVAISAAVLVASAGDVKQARDGEGDESSRSIQALAGGSFSSVQLTHDLLPAALYDLADKTDLLRLLCAKIPRSQGQLS